MTEAAPEEPNLMGEMLPTGPLEHAQSPMVKDFKPWHLPRKHYVRQKQWGGAVQNLIGELPQFQSTINYLCLPGEDLLDVQVLAEIADPLGKKLHYMGFDSHAGTVAAGSRSVQRAAAEQILRQGGAVVDTSEVIPHSFATIATAGSIGWKKLCDRGTYDVVNLDMCDSFTTTDNAHNHDAMLNLLNHQSEKRGYPWLLFLTTRSEVDRLQPHELHAYDALIRKNTDSSDSFRNLLARMLSLPVETTAQALGAALRERRAGDNGLSGRWLTLAIGKWILGVVGQSPSWRVDLLSVYCFRAGLLSPRGAAQHAAEPPNLFSMAFHFRKIAQPRSDPADLARTTLDPGEIDEGRLAVKMATCVEQNILDLDCQMQSDPTASAKLASECRSLLNVRHYSPEEYTKWVALLPRIECP